MQISMIWILTQVHFTFFPNDISLIISIITIEYSSIIDLFITAIVHDGSMDRSGMFKSGGTADSRGEAATMSVADQEKIATYRMILSNIARSENEYVEVLNKLLQYMKAIKATLATSKPVLSTDEFNIIFYKIPELFAMHQKFLNGMQQKSAATIGVGIHFENLVMLVLISFFICLFNLGLELKLILL